ncbi:NADH:flavin oxidoreductase [Novosphingobium sp. TH158]|uniref:NADH:flavin oxidoreductase n=1 Tax=Novosphingobium sp. TH158 TaxID=2067455 RepID=UPI000C79D61A|nr:NADH:flavin oxidoreductase [Novosphingobium sp. TH158]PLK26970.1 NADH:flavin oxidoreductase [Novosphingobium sp. TH158]
MTDPYAPLTFPRGPAMLNRFMLAPLTNKQSHADGTLSDEEFHWLTLRAQGGFGLVMTCAAHVQKEGQGFAGQLGIWSDDHLPGLARLAQGIRDGGALSSVQLHHAGLRSPQELIGEVPQGPFAEPDNGRALTTAEVGQLRDDFIAAAQRAEKAGFDGVEIHGAHGYVLCQFLDPANNRREDGYGGSYEGRTRIFREIIAGIRAATGPQFQLGLRLSAERFNIDFAEAKTLAAELMAGGELDYLDMSLWDCFNQPADPAHAGKSLIAHFAELPRGATRLGVAGKIMDMDKVRACLAEGVDFVLLGRAAILNHDFPNRGRADAGFGPTPTPVTRDHLRREGLSEGFIDYFATFPGYVAA